LESLKVQLEEVAKEVEQEQQKEKSTESGKAVEPVTPVPAPTPATVAAPAEQVVLPVTTPIPSVNATPNGGPDTREALRRLLKAFHVCARYQQRTGKPLPSTLDFFGKSLLGMTSIRPFPDTLETSVKCAEKYINVSTNDCTSAIISNAVSLV
jgi:hypothetical protein